MKPLVLNTRPQGKQRPLTLRLQAEGLEVIEAPMLAIDMERARQELKKHRFSFKAHDWVVFTSGNGAESLAGVERIRKVLNVPRTAVVGKGTAEVAESVGFKVEFVSGVANSDAFSDEFLTLLEGERAREKGVKVYLFRANTAGQAFPALLASSGYDVHSYTAYYSVTPSLAEDEVELLGGSLGLLDAREGADVVNAMILTSSRAIKNLIEVLQHAETLWRQDWLHQLRSIPVVVIGPKTEQTALENGFRRVVEARDTNNESLAEAVLQMLGKV